MSNGAEQTVLEVCVVAAGNNVKSLRKAAQVCEFILEWTIATKALGHEPGIAEFGKWWKHSEKDQRTAYRRLAQFRELFPAQETPSGFSAVLLKGKAAQKVEFLPLTRLAV